MKMLEGYVSDAFLIGHCVVITRLLRVVRVSKKGIVPTLDKPVT